MIRAPKPFSILLVIATALPSPSTIDTCVVEGRSADRPARQAPVAALSASGCPAVALPAMRSPISAARRRR